MSISENSESNQSAIPKAPAKNRKRRRFAGKHYSRFMKLVRRTHMYTGLILLPWVLLFGASGVLFNHPTWLSSAITHLHQLHHYPDNLGARWLWMLAADATGLMLVFWGISGVIMWWQIKPTRLVGVSGLIIAAVIAFLVISGTLTELGFGPPSFSRGASVERSDRNNQRGMIPDEKSASNNASGELPTEGF